MMIEKNGTKKSITEKNGLGVQNRFDRAGLCNRGAWCADIHLIFSPNFIRTLALKFLLICTKIVVVLWNMVYNIGVDPPQLIKTWRC